jgi:hypothetical protein
VLVELGTLCIRDLYDGREDEGRDDVFVSAVVGAELGQRQAKGVKDRQDVGWGRQGRAGQGNTALPGRNAHGPISERGTYCASGRWAP